MENQELIKLAKQCVEDYKQSLVGKNGVRYVSTLYFAIDDDDNIYSSYYVDILSRGSQCILLHTRSELAVTNCYNWYEIFFINKNGEVLNNRIDEIFSVKISCWGSFSNQVLDITFDHFLGGHWDEPWEYSIKEMWKLYTRLKDVPTNKERKLICELYSKDKKILELQKEVEDFKFTTHFLEEQRNNYKELLEEIKNIVSKEDQ